MSKPRSDFKMLGVPRFLFLLIFGFTQVLQPSAFGKENAFEALGVSQLPAGTQFVLKKDFHKKDKAGKVCAQLNMKTGECEDEIDTSHDRPKLGRECFMSNGDLPLSAVNAPYVLEAASPAPAQAGVFSFLIRDKMKTPIYFKCARSLFDFRTKDISIGSLKEEIAAVFEVVDPPVVSTFTSGSPALHDANSKSIHDDSLSGVAADAVQGAAGGVQK